MVIKIQLEPTKDKLRGYGHITQNECCPNWANTSNLKNSNMDEYFRELFRDVRNWEHFYQIILYLPNSSVPNFGPDLT